MKIKRTLPSISAALPHRDSLMGDQLRPPAEFPSHIDVIDEAQKREEAQIISRLSGSNTKIFRRSISRSKATVPRSRDQAFVQSGNNMTSSKDIQKSASEVSFKNQSEGGWEKRTSNYFPKSQTEKVVSDIVQGNSPVSKKIRSYENASSKGSQRKKIFDNPRISTGNSRRDSHEQDVCTKKREQDELTKKISDLENIVKNLMAKLDHAQPAESTREYQPSKISTSDNSEVRRLTLELEQMRRCERIAQENNLLYSRLASSIDNSLHGRSYLDNSAGRGLSQVLRFQDYQDANDLGFSQNEEGICEITSPFLLEENRPSPYTVRAYPIIRK